MKNARPFSKPGVPLRFCGEGGIRTLGTVTRTHDFQSCTFGHSVTSPEPRASRRGRVWGLGQPALAPTYLPPSGAQPAERTSTASGVEPRGTRPRGGRRAKRDGWGQHPSGERGIRTLGTLTGTPDFESGTFGHSDISPRRTMSAEGGSVNERAGTFGRLLSVRGRPPGGLQAGPDPEDSRGHAPVSAWARAPAA